MGADDDADCVEHEWQLAEIGMRDGRLDKTYECARCDAVSYDAAPDPRKRPRL